MDRLDDYIAGLSLWFEQPLGRELLKLEQQAYASYVHLITGERALFLGCSPSSLHFDNFLSKTIYLYLQDVIDPNQTLLRGNPYELPFASNSIDFICLSHVLEAMLYPQQCLNELSRVLTPQGHLLVLSFNPWSWWGLWRLFRKSRNQAPWNGRFLGTTYLHSLLREADCDIVSRQRIFYRPPLAKLDWLQRMAFLEQLRFKCWPAGVNLMLARKRVSALTPIRPFWGKRKIVNVEKSI